MPHRTRGVALPSLVVAWQLLQALRVIIAPLGNQSIGMLKLSHWFR